MNNLSVEKPCSGADYVHLDKTNYCNEDHICTAADYTELIACRFYIEEKNIRPGTCVGLSAVGDRCNDPCANEAAKTGYIKDILRRDS